MRVQGGCSISSSGALRARDQPRLERLPRERAEPAADGGERGDGRAHSPRAARRMTSSGGSMPVQRSEREGALAHEQLEAVDDRQAGAPARRRRAASASHRRGRRNRRRRPFARSHRQAREAALRSAMPPTGVQWTSRPPRPAGTVAAASTSRAGARDRPARRPGGRPPRAGARRRELPRAGPQQGCGGRPGAAAGTEHDGALRAPPPSAATRPSPSVRSPRSAPSGREAERVDGPRVARLVAQLVAQRDGGGLVRQRDVGAVEAERREAADGRAEIGRAPRAARRRRGRARAPRRPRCACAASASARPGRRSRRRRASRPRSSCRVRLLEVLEVGERAREVVAPLRVARDRDVVQVRHLRGMRRGLQRGQPGIADRRRRQARGACACCSRP